MVTISDSHSLSLAKDNHLLSKQSSPMKRMPYTKLLMPLLALLHAPVTFVKHNLLIPPLPLSSFSILKILTISTALSLPLSSLNYPTTTMKRLMTYRRYFLDWLSTLFYLATIVSSSLQAGNVLHPMRALTGPDRARPCNRSLCVEPGCDILV